jgi:hypothetical protein
MTEIKRKPLAPEEKVVLVALADACNWSLTARVPVEAVCARFRKDKRGMVKDVLEELRRRGYAWFAKGTWYISREGLAEAEKSLKPT